MYVFTVIAYACMHAYTTRAYYERSKPTKIGLICKELHERQQREAREVTKGECRISYVLLMCDFTQFQAWLTQ